MNDEKVGKSDITLSDINRLKQLEKLFKKNEVEDTKKLSAQQSLKEITAGIDEKINRLVTQYSYAEVKQFAQQHNLKDNGRKITMLSRLIEQGVF